ncbi:hypothetical protein [Moorena producens]|uniref:hypothetical protein n=1 Tax=Moorena producens TaxID=1155739 RepID=UPI003C765357
MEREDEETRKITRGRYLKINFLIVSCIYNFFHEPSSKTAPCSLLPIPRFNLDKHFSRQLCGIGF